MTMRPFTDNRGGLNHIVDAQIGRAFPVVHKVYRHLDTIEYIAQVFESGRSRDIVIRTNHTKEWIEWQYKGEAKWTILFKFSDLLGADIADVVAAEQAIAAELVALRVHIDQARSDTLAASERAQVAELGAVVAKDAAEAAQASASTSAQEASVSAVAAAQSAQGIHDVKDATEVIAATAETYRDAAAQSAQQAADSANNADSVKDFVVSARAEAEGFATTATTASTEAKAAQQAAESSAAAALTSENQASASALASAASETAAAAKLGEVTTLHDAAVIASTAATEAAESATTHLAQVTALHSATETFAQAAQASAEQADIAATAAGVSASNALQLRNETQGFHDAASAMVVDAAQVSADRATVQTLAQEVQLAAGQAQSNALAAADSADTAVASANAAAISATDAQTKADVVQGQVTAITGRLDEADSIVATVTALRDETLSYKLAVQDSTTNAQAVAADRAAVANMMGTIAADAASAADSKDQALAAAATAVQAEAAANTAITVAQNAAQEVANNITAAQDAAAAALGSQTSASESATQAAASLTAVVPLHTEVVTKHADILVRADQVAEDLLATNAAKSAAESAQTIAETAETLARAWATKTDGPVLNDGGDKFSAQYWATQAEQSATVAADANTGALSALANHTAAADPHPQYLTKAESTDALAAKVDKVAGKGLSTNDFTATLLNKLNGIEANANNFSLPTGISGQVLKHNGTDWVAGTDNISTYSDMSSAEGVAGTATTGRLITPVVLKEAIVTHAPAPTSDTVVGLLPAGTNGQVLKHNGTTWVADADANTTYSTMSAAEANAGTATSACVITAAVLKGAIQTFAPVQTTITGNAGSATKLATAQTINGVSFDGTANIIVADSTKLPLAGGALTGEVTSTSTLKINNTTASTSATTGAITTAGGVGIGGAMFITGAITSADNITAYSDIRLKKDLVEIDGALAKVKQLTGYTYTRIDTGERQTGLVAQDVQKVLPEAVQDNEDHLSVAYGNLVGLLVNSIKELEQRVAELEKKAGGI